MFSMQVSSENLEIIKFPTKILWQVRTNSFEGFFFLFWYATNLSRIDILNIEYYIVYNSSVDWIQFWRLVGSFQQENRAQPK